MEKKKAKKLFILWLIVFVVVAAAVSVWASIYALENHLPKKDLPEQAKLIGSAVLLLVFCPPLGYIHQCAKKEQAKDIQKKASRLLLFLCVAAIGNVIAILF